MRGDLCQSLGAGRFKTDRNLVAVSAKLSFRPGHFWPHMVIGDRGTILYFLGPDLMGLDFGQDASFPAFFLGGFDLLRLDIIDQFVPPIFLWYRANVFSSSDGLCLSDPNVLAKSRWIDGRMSFAAFFAIR